jgi:hypothetical protein
MYKTNQKIRLRKDIEDTEDWCVTKMIQKFSDNGTILTIRRNGEDTVLVNELSENTFIDKHWIDTLFTKNDLPEELFTI